MRLLLAEDDFGLRSVLHRGLKEEGYVVDAVPTGNEALDHLCTYEYAICVVDWRMPGASGLDIITWARGRGLRTPFLVLTANDGRRDRARALEQGAERLRGQAVRLGGPAHPDPSTSAQTQRRTWATIRLRVS
jgi:DNA-binding response OmpR family regulator